MTPVTKFAAWLAIAMAISSPAASSAEFSFDPFAVWPVDLSVHQAAVGDFNGDGRDDMVVLGSRRATKDLQLVRIYLQQADGSMQPPHEFATDGTYLRLADFDGDTRTDVIIGSPNMRSFQALFGNANGTFSSIEFSNENIDQPLDCWRFVLLDVDLDGSMDIVCHPAHGEQSTALFGDGRSGISSSARFETLGAIETHGWDLDDFAAGDVTGDGIDDLVFTSIWTPGVHVFAHDGGAGFLPVASYPVPSSTGITYGAILIQDFTGDGRNDVVVSRNSSSSQVLLYEQLGDGALGTATVLPAPNGGYILAAADLDGGEGKDLLVGSHTTLSRVLFADGTPGSAASDPAPALFDYGTLAAGDLDGDGCTDAVAAAMDAGIMMLRGRCGSSLGSSLRKQAASNGLTAPVQPAAARDVLVATAPYRQFIAFDPYLSIPAAAHSRAIAVGDVSGDGRDDLVYTVLDHGIPSSTTTSVRLQLEDGTLSAPVSLEGGGTLLVLADLDGDGVEDIVSNDGAPLRIWLSLGEGKFHETSPANARFSYDDCNALVSLDVDRNGDMDLACHSSRAGRATVHLGDGSGGIVSSHRIQTFGTNHASRLTLGEMEAADLTGDGLDDLFLRNPQALFVLAHDGIDGFTAPVQHPNPFLDKTFPIMGDVAIGDFNADGRNDLLAPYIGQQWQYSVALLLQDAQGQLGAPSISGVNDPFYRTIVAALDNDGFDDIIVQGENTVVPYAAGGNGWVKGQPAPAPVAPGAFPSAGDLDGDGCIDVATLGRNQDLILLHGQCVEDDGGGDDGGGDDGGGDDGGVDDGGVDDGGDDGGGDDGSGDDDENGDPDPQPELPILDIESDFNGDGRSDLLWRNVATGGSALWSAADYLDQIPVKGITNLAWQPAGAGDFDGDGRADLVWRNTENGRNAIWKAAQEADKQGIAMVRKTQWVIDGIGDFNGDGVDDLLWRNTINGRNALWHSANARDQRHMPIVRNTDWTIAFVADFNSDGVDDLFWHNPVTGANTLWHSASSRDQDNIGDLQPGWVPAGVGDFDGDRRVDILWRHPDGTNVYWPAARKSEAVHVPTAPPVWTAAAVADFDGDGIADILWRHGRLGTNTLWLSANPRTQLPATDVRDLDWSVVP